MSVTYDVIIVGAGPGGIAAALKAKEYNISCVVIEKGQKVFDGICESYPAGKKVYPTVPRTATEPFYIDELKPPDEKITVEEYVESIKKVVHKHDINIRYGEDFEDIDNNNDIFLVRTSSNSYRGRYIILAFGSNIPNELTVWGEAKTVARNITDVEDFLGVPCLVIGGGNTSADIVSTISKAKRENMDPYPVFWAHRTRQFTIDKNVAHDLGEEILLGGNIKILQGAEPKIGEVDEEGIERLLIQTQKYVLGELEMVQGLSFPMKYVIASIGTHGPEPIFTKLNLQQIKCVGRLCKIGKEGTKLLVLNQYLETTTNGIYAIGGAVSPAYMLIGEDGSIKEQKHPNLIYTASNDGVIAIESIKKSMTRTS